MMLMAEGPQLVEGLGAGHVLGLNPSQIFLMIRRRLLFVRLPKLARLRSRILIRRKRRRRHQPSDPPVKRAQFPHEMKTVQRYHVTWALRDRRASR